MSTDRPNRSDILEIAAACRRLGGIDLAVGVPASPARPTAVQGAVEALYAGHNRYADARGVPELRAAIAHRLATEHGLPVDPDREMLVTAGVTAGFAATTMALFARGDELLVFEPYFGWHVRLIRLAGLVPRFVRLQGPDYALDLETLERCVGPRTRGIVLCTPNNPCGKVWTDAELAAVEAVVLEHGLTVITDEQYEAFCFDGSTHRSPAARPGLRPQTVVLGGFSKSLSITGWRMAYAAAPATLIEAIRLMHTTLYICPATPLQHGVARALPALDLTVERARLQANRDLLVGALRDAGFEVHVPQAGLFVMADAGPISSLSSGPLAMTLLERAGVAAVPGRAFYDGADDGSMLRFCFARPRAVLDEAIRRLRAMPRGVLSARRSRHTASPAVPVDLRPIVDQRDVDAAAELAYVQYVERMGILGDLADHDQRRLYADDTAGATVVGAFAGDQLAGCITVMFHADAPFPPFYDAAFDIGRFEAVVPRSKMTIITRLLVAPEHQGGTLAMRLMAMALSLLIERETTLIFADSQPHLVPMYERMGLRPFGRPFNYGASGIGIPLVAGLFDRDYFTGLGSPLAAFVPRRLDDPAAAGQLAQAIGADRPVYAQASTPERFEALIGTRVPALAAGTDDASIFRGFDAGEVRRVLRRGYILDCPAGIKLIARGQRTRSVYIVLAGRIGVQLPDRTIHLGPGAVLGEIAFLTHDRRTADVWVEADDTRVLCLGEKTMRALGEGEPALAARFLGNLSRTLARRMADLYRARAATGA